ncbi:MAG: trypsin-like peptidase domain-containing protein [Candidatus Rokubacteria bacterium]|nr:trypsin-like peptidase domain-containing protein [Candidatus Rokubacteria bacterium]
MPRSRSARSSATAVLLLLLVAPLASCSIAGEGAAAERARCSKPIPDIFAEVAPTVVFIAAKSINPYQLTDRVTRIVGSGVIVDPAGLVLTNSHVAFGRQSITVTLNDGTIQQAELVGADPIFDLALLRIPPPAKGGLPAAALGDSDSLRVGEDVIAIGNPLGLSQSLTRGVVSAINRILPETPLSLYEPLIQTDAPINPGNSGGPLLNACGEVIGINTSIIPDAQNIGFAIPINLVKAVIPALLARGRVVRPWIGFHGQHVDPALRELLRIPLVEGLLVEVIEPGSPAEQAGIRGGQLEIAIGGREILIGGDIVTSLNTTRLNSPDTIIEAMRSLKVGETVRLTVYRDGEYRDVEYRLPERPLLPGDVPPGTVTPGAERRIPPPSPGNQLRQ